MKPGDILLFWADGSAASKAISAYQLYSGYPALSNKITHVAMYVGDTKLVHATYSPILSAKASVREESTREALLGRQITAVSPFWPDDDPSARQRLVAEALSEIGKPYSTQIIALHILVTMLPERVRPYLQGQLATKIQTAQICSKLVYETYAAAVTVNNPLDNPKAPQLSSFVVPADFFVNSKLRTLNLGAT